MLQILLSSKNFALRGTHEIHRQFHEVSLHSRGEKIVNISAVPGGYKASSEEDKTLTSALVNLLEATEKGIPLGELKERLRKEQDKQNSRNFPDVKGSLSFGLVQGLFPV